jgi:hypothetical protein
MEVCKYDPAHEWDKHCELEERELARRQMCGCCCEPITDDYCYLIDGEYICQDCMNDYYLVETPVEGE